MSAVKESRSALHHGTHSHLVLTQFVGIPFWEIFLDDVNSSPMILCTPTVEAQSNLFRSPPPCPTLRCRLPFRFFSVSFPFLAGI
jgi:hypothetical protein